MNIEKRNLDKARKLLKELEALEEVRDVQSNYDASVSVVFTTLHNNNRKTLKEVRISMPSIDVRNSINEYVQNRIYEIKKELESL